MLKALNNKDQRIPAARGAWLQCGSGDERRKEGKLVVPGQLDVAIPLQLVSAVATNSS